MREKRTRDGIPVDDTTWEEILRAADKVKLPRDRVQALAKK
jgi:LDH2 family malate/lactate/ureidoglycolate dehydrogenase